MADSSSPPIPNISRSTVEQLVGFSVDDLSLYRRAFTHRSVLRSHPERHLLSNERLEFLGDAMLDLVVGEVLYHRFPEENEGYLSRLRAKLVCGTALARYARHLNLGAHLLLSKNTARDEGRTNPNILADAFEALVGAVYLDQGHETAHRFVRERALAPFDLAEVAALSENHKSRLQEHLQAKGEPTPTYHVLHEEGPSHDKQFTVQVKVNETVYGQGTAGSKQQAEQRAAQEALNHLRTTTDDSFDGDTDA